VDGRKEEEGGGVGGEIIYSLQRRRWQKWKKKGILARLLEEVVITVIWERLSSGHGQLLLVLLLLGKVDLDLGRGESSIPYETKVLLTRELAGEVLERPLVVVVGLGGNLVVLEVLLAVEGNLLGLDLTVLDVHLVAAENDGDILADTADITVPSRDVLVRQTGGDIEHNDGALAVDVVAIAEATELLLTRGIPAEETNLPDLGVKIQRVDLNTDGGLVLLLELTSQVALKI